jgi:hypothetical protein
MSGSNNITVLLKEVEKIYKQIDELKQDPDRLEIKKYVESMSKLIDTKENLLKIILDLNSKISPTISDYSLSQYTFFDDIDIKNMQTVTYDFKEINSKSKSQIFLHPNKSLKRIYDAYDNNIRGNITYPKNTHTVTGIIDNNGIRILEYPICNICLDNYSYIHDFLKTIKYEFYTEHIKKYYLSKNVCDIPISYSPLFTFIGMNLPDPHYNDYKINDNTPCRYLSIFLMYQSLVKQKNVIRIEENKNDIFSFEFENDCTVKYLYIVNNEPIKILPNNYVQIKLQGNTKYYFYSRIFI